MHRSIGVIITLKIILSMAGCCMNTSLKFVYACHKMKCFLSTNSWQLTLIVHFNFSLTITKSEKNYEERDDSSDEDYEPSFDLTLR